VLLLFYSCLTAGKQLPHRSGDASPCTRPAELPVLYCTTVVLAAIARLQYQMYRHTAGHCTAAPLPHPLASWTHSQCYMSTGVWAEFRILSFQPECKPFANWRPAVDCQWRCRQPPQAWGSRATQSSDSPSRLSLVHAGGGSPSRKPKWRASPRPGTSVGSA
jgi:hypothetical protein